MSNITGVPNSFNANQFIEKAQTRFNNADADQSGSVSKQEFLSAMEGVKAPDKAEKFFERLDKDGDGVVSQQEHQNAIDKMASRLSEMTSGTGGIEQTANAFEMLLKSMEESEQDASKANELRDMLSKLQSDGITGQSLEQSIENFDQLYPRIDTKA